MEFVIFDIWVPATPQRGSWCAGVTVRNLSKPELPPVLWHGGPATYEGETARLFPFPERPTIRFHGVRPGNTYEVFLAIDDDPKKAGTAQAADKLTFQFRAVRDENNHGQSHHFHQEGDWKVNVEYLFHD